MTPGALAVGLLGMVPGVGGTLAGALGWCLSALVRVLLDASYAGATWLGCPAVRRPGLVVVCLYMVVLAILACCCRPQRCGVPTMC